MPPLTDFFYIAFHLSTDTVHYRQRAVYDRLEFLELLNNWNACSRGTWQYYGVTPGFSCSSDTSKYERVTYTAMLPIRTRHGVSTTSISS
jgi:hypothetical protein